MRLLVSGSSGFIGHHVVAAARERGHEITTLDRGTLSSSDRLASFLRERAPEACIHLAWCANPLDYLTTLENVTHLNLGIVLAHALSAAGCRRLLVTGTCIEYDVSLGYLSERSALAPKYLYSICKRALFDALSTGSSMTLTWARLFFLYGPGERPGRLISDVVAQLLDGKVPRVRSGGHTRDYIHVTDAAHALVHLVEIGLHGPVNVASGRPVTVREIVEIARASVERRVGRGTRIDWDGVASRTSDAPFICADIELLRATGFVPRFTLARGIDDYVEKEEVCRKS